MNISEIVLKPIGLVRSPIREALDDVWGGVTARIELDASRFTTDALAGLEEFSHVEIVFVLDQVTQIASGKRHPRGRTDWPEVGIFAQRGRNRPNRIGLTTCRLVAVHDLAIEVEGLDAIDGTPVIDIKPYVQEFGPRGEIRQPAWCTELMSTYWGKP